MQTIDEVRDLVDIELLSLAGGYDADDAANNVRILNDIRKSVKDMGKGIYPKPEHIAEVAIAANENLQMRDFLLGLRIEKDIAEYSFNYLHYLGLVLKKEICIPIAAVFSTYIYELGQKDEANRVLDEILEVNPNYSLARLLKQFFGNDVPEEMMTEMANDLHNAVIRNIEGDLSDNSNS